MSKKPCKHFWIRMGVRGEGRGWPDGHALVRCRHCGKWTVVEYGSVGPCEHVVGRPLHETFSSSELYVAYELALRREQGDDPAEEADGA